MFKLINVNLGEIKTGIMQVISFPYTELNKIIKMESPCDCSIPENDITNQRIIVKFTPKPIPVHLKQQGIDKYQVTKPITVTFNKKETPNQNEVVVLNFSATIIE